jgi:ribose transport system permease protein
MSAFRERITGSQSPLSSERSLRWSLTLIRLGPAIILLLLIMVFNLLSPVFLTVQNVSNIVAQTSALAVLAIGQLFVILVAGIDLSVGSVLALSTVTGALVFTWNQGLGGSLSVATFLLTGLVAGFLNGFMLTKGKLPHAFIPTLAMFYAASGLALVLSNGRAIPQVPGIVGTLGNGYLGPIPVPVLLVAALALLAVVLTKRLKWGRWIYLVGGDREAARRVGIPVDRVILSVFVISGLMAGFAGVITAGRTSSGYPTAGELAELQAIAAVIIGGGSFFGGRGSVAGVLVGALILGVIANGLNLLNVDEFWQLIVAGAIIVFAVELDVLRRYLEGRFRTLQARGA